MTDRNADRFTSLLRVVLDGQKQLLTSIGNLREGQLRAADEQHRQACLLTAVRSEVAVVKLSVDELRAEMTRRFDAVKTGLKDIESGLAAKEQKPLSADRVSSRKQRLERLASRYIRGTSPARTVDESLPRLIAEVMEVGTWEDAAEMMELVEADAIGAVLDAPPAGVISARSLAFWHARLGRPGDPPLPKKRFE